MRQIPASDGFPLPDRPPVVVRWRRFYFWEDFGPTEKFAPRLEQMAPGERVANFSSTKTFPVTPCENLRLCAGMVLPFSKCSLGGIQRPTQKIRRGKTIRQQVEAWRRLFSALFFPPNPMRYSKQSSFFSPDTGQDPQKSEFPPLAVANLPRGLPSEQPPQKPGQLVCVFTNPLRRLFFASLLADLFSKVFIRYLLSLALFLAASARRANEDCSS